MRVIYGEVLSSETERVNPREANQAFKPRAKVNQKPSDKSANRRVSSQRAIQNFKDNEALVVNVYSPRQVSGIIYEIV